MINSIFDITALKNNYDKAKHQLSLIQDNKIDGLEPIDYLFQQFEINIDPIYFIENILRAHLPESKRHLHANQIELIRAACNPNIRKIAAMFSRQSGY